MAHKNHITLSQVMAMIALLGILLSVVGTTWISQTPIPTSSESVISGEQMVVSPELPVVQK